MYTLCVATVTCVFIAGTILANKAVSFGPRSFAEYAAVGAPAAAGTLLLQLLLSVKVPFRDVVRSLQDNFTVFMTLIRANMIGFFGIKLGFAVTNKVRHSITAAAVTSACIATTATATAATANAIVTAGAS
jgi:hypothetical protein